MGIRDFIERQKASFSSAARGDKLRLQKQMLQEKRRSVEAKNVERAKKLRLKTDVSEEKRKLRRARMGRFAPAREKAKKAIAGFKKANKKVKEINARREKNMKRMMGGESPRGGPMASNGSSSPFMKSSSSRGGVLNMSGSARGGVLGDKKKKRR